jgi:hypothetical protein
LVFWFGSSSKANQLFFDWFIDFPCVVEQTNQHTIETTRNTHNAYTRIVNNSIYIYIYINKYAGGTWNKLEI